MHLTVRARSTVLYNTLLFISRYVATDTNNTWKADGGVLAIPDYIIIITLSVVITFGFPPENKIGPKKEPLKCTAKNCGIEIPIFGWRYIAKHIFVSPNIYGRVKTNIMFGAVGTSTQISVFRYRSFSQYI